ncbi:serine/threonine-protein kinase Nek10-like [Octopus sinensis]|uniref:non-specific serine/threonine protein kinase n=1 Tax=Octopus sinensis TaxID=2607531 RepID=A0A6P7TS42_9MOLL|nr:serine/threonine-protein kinase Nek10-like [Octopus sinensis]
MIEQLKCMSNTSARYVRNYQLYSVIGSGAFGVVYCAKKNDGNKWFAIKEACSFTKNLQIKTWMLRNLTDGNIENTIRELAMIEQELDHPNIVKYYKTFLENDSLYILMDYIDGISIDHFVFYAQERDQNIEEDRIWGMTVQWGQGHFAGASVGFKWSSPEIVLNKDYTNKVDIWSMGCVLYNICQHKLPFNGENMLELVTNVTHRIKS